MLPQFTYKTTTFSSQIRPENTLVFHPDSSGKEKDSETGYHYFGARYYNSDLSLWLSVDPMADKYPSLSPYNYCAWNPMKLVDPDGNKILPAKGSSEKFKEQLNEAINHLISHGAGEIYSQLENSPVEVYIEEISFNQAAAGKTKNNDKKHTIRWCPTAGLYTDGGDGQDIILSPTTQLNHEFDHALQGINKPKQKEMDRATEMGYEDYGNKEEYRVITGSEQKTALLLGEIKEGQVTRKNHFGAFNEVSGPTSNKLVHPENINRGATTSRVYEVRPN